MTNIVAYPVEYGQRHVVLVVESEPGASRFLCDHLRRLGFHAASVAQSQEAQRLIALGITFDIVVSDIGLAHGLRLAHWVMDRAPNLPLVLIAPDIHPVKDLLCGAEIFAKPYALGALARKIRDTLARNRPRQVKKPKRHWQAGALLPFARGLRV